MSGFPGSGGFPLTLTGTPAAGKVIAATSSTAGVWTTGAVVAATTPGAGTALINGTQTFLTWTAPADGNAHEVLLVATLVVTTLEVGGAVHFNWTTLGTANTPVLYANALAAGTYVSPWQGVPVDPGTTVSVTQTNPLTGGASTFTGVLLVA